MIKEFCPKISLALTTESSVLKPAKSSTILCSWDSLFLRVHFHIFWFTIIFCRIVSANQNILLFFLICRVVLASILLKIEIFPSTFQNFALFRAINLPFRWVIFECHKKQNFWFLFLFYNLPKTKGLIFLRKSDQNDYFLKFSCL